MHSSFFAPFRSPLSSVSSITAQLRSLQPLTTIRTFKPVIHVTKVSELPKPVTDLPMPEYPYGPRRFFKQADRGLYGGKAVQYGNKVSKGRNKGKTRRRWMPNIRIEKHHSKALDMDITIRVTAHCARTIKKCGGLDEYVCGSKAARIKELGLYGWQLRWRVMNAPSMKEQIAKRRAELGLPPQPESFDEVWDNPELKTQLLAEQKKTWAELREKDLRFQEHVRNKWEKADKKEYELNDMVPKTMPTIY